MKLERPQKDLLKYEEKCLASKALHAIVASGVIDRHTALGAFLASAKKRGCLPDENAVMRDALSALHFFMQSTRLEQISIQEVMDRLCSVDEAVVLIQTSRPFYINKEMHAFIVRGNHYREIPTDAGLLLHLQYSTADHVWIRWNDGIDRSPYPRRKVRRSAVIMQDTSGTENEWYKHFQPNPCNLLTDDCVIRAFAGAMGISWAEALDLLGTPEEPRVNDPRNFSWVFEQLGFTSYPEPARRMTVKEFCAQADRTFHHGERFIVMLKIMHVVAIVPTTYRNRVKYRVMDSWDTTDKLVDSYWQLPDQA